MRLSEERRVDGTLREILGWGIAEPGGAGRRQGPADKFPGYCPFFAAKRM